MAYDKRKVLTFGVAGVVMAALLILVFAPTQIEVGINPTVALQEIPGFGFQFVKMSSEQADLVQLYITLSDFEIKKQDGSWVEASEGNISLNLLRGKKISFGGQVENLNIGNYTAIRFRVVRGMEFSNATLSNGVIIAVDVPSLKVELNPVSFEIDEQTESLLLDLQTGSGMLSNYMLPELHLAFGTMKVEINVRVKENIH
jgi:hypothetical protein